MNCISQIVNIGRGVLVSRPATIRTLHSGLTPQSRFDTQIPITLLLTSNQSKVEKTASSYLLVDRPQHKIPVNDAQLQKYLTQQRLIINDFHIQVPTAQEIPARIGYISPDIKAILDPLAVHAVIGDPLSENGNEPIGDHPDSMKNPEYKARHIQKIRRWHMNRHRLKKFRKRMRMVIRKRKSAVKKRKEERLIAEIKAIKKDGEEFDALSFVKERLQRSKTGGFVHDIHSTPDQQPEVPWEDYSQFKRLRTYEQKVFPVIKFKYRVKKKKMRGKK